MNEQQLARAFNEGFLKRASEYGISAAEAVKLAQDPVYDAWSRMGAAQTHPSVVRKTPTPIVTGTSTASAAPHATQPVSRAAELVGPGYSPSGAPLGTPTNKLNMEALMKHVNPGTYSAGTWSGGFDPKNPDTYAPTQAKLKEYLSQPKPETASTVGGIPTHLAPFIGGSNIAELPN